MAKLLSILTLILAIALFPPAALALISNNAVPGDRIYPIKRGLEAGILAIASVNPTTKAWFTIKRSERRFNEVTHLFEAGDRTRNVSVSLSDLVKHTQEAAKEVVKIQNPQERKQKVAELKASIKKYQQELESEKKKVDTEQPNPIPIGQSSPTPTPTPVIHPTSTPTPSPTPRPSPTQSPTPAPSGARATRATPTPTPRVIPSPTVTPTPIPVAELNCSDPNLSEAYKIALNCLGEIILPEGDPIVPPQTVNATPTPTPVAEVRGRSGGPTPELVIIPTSTPTPEPTVAPTPTPTPIPSICTACQADLDGDGQVSDNDINNLENSCTIWPDLRHPDAPSYCQKMDVNGNHRIDSIEISCARSKLGQICVQ